MILSFFVEANDFNDKRPSYNHITEKAVAQIGYVLQSVMAN